MTTPNPALYVHNLNDKVNKEEICLQLYSLFSTYGSVIDLVASKGKKMKGQAFVVFADLASATAAMRSCEGMSFYDKQLVRPIQVAYTQK
jgi:RNA recognition motif-containing protein